MTDSEQHGISRRDVLRTGAAAGVAAALGGVTSAEATTVGQGQGVNLERLVLTNGQIHTMDADNRVVDEVAIEDGRFVEVGRVTSRAGTVVNLDGHVVVPGVIDNHNHIVLMGNRPGHHTPLENAYSIADVQQTYAARAQGIPAGAWITTIGGFHRNHLVPPTDAPRLPTLAELDAAVPNNPAYISEGFSGPSVTNTPGKAFFESRGIVVGANGAIAPGTATGQATLVLRQTLLTFDERKRGVRDAMAYAVGLGVTTHLDQGAFQAVGAPSDGAAHEDNFTMHLPFLSVYDDGDGIVRLRINFLHMDPTLEVPTLTERLKNAFPFFGNDWVRTGGIGEFLAQGLGPNWLEAARRVAQAGWRGEVHSLSPTDFQTEIQGFETVNAEFPITDLRWVVAHVPFITEDYVNRLKAVGGGLSLTGWRYLAGSPTGNGPPFRMIVNNGINAGMSSDGMQIAPMNPWLHMYYATTGLNARGVLINGGQQITRQEVLELYTSRNGWFLREEDQLGSIEEGKLGDLVVLDRDYFTVPDEELKQIRSVLTVVDGQIVHDSGEVGRQP
jgi:predicted amidohydrolase YtcJ